MNTDRRIKEHFQEFNLSYTSADDAINRLLCDHKQHRENNRLRMKIMRDTQNKAKRDAEEYVKQLDEKYISINELQQMTIQEIVDILK